MTGGLYRSSVCRCILLRDSSQETVSNLDPSNEGADALEFVDLQNYDVPKKVVSDLAIVWSYQQQHIVFSRLVQTVDN